MSAEAKKTYQNLSVLWAEGFFALENKIYPLPARRLRPLR